MDAVQRAREDEKKKLLEIKPFAQLQSCFAKIQLPKSWTVARYCYYAFSILTATGNQQKLPWMCAPTRYLTAFSETQMIQLVEPKGRYRWLMKNAIPVPEK